MNVTPGPRRRPAGPHPESATTAGPTVPSPRGSEPGALAGVPAQRTAADVYRVSEDQVHRARMAVARNALDSEDCRDLLDMLGLIGEPGEPPPVRR
ncbi:hypothetical protein WCD74_28410 [Actinomycetospora sp. OC33-EN08]|uniref:Uncharacterized protein n=1 Tax=Actinomycetospora aurantiaca TaxID=3129233 RepID=A0ABU8MXT8_9PSEU